MSTQGASPPSPSLRSRVPALNPMWVVPAAGVIAAATVIAGLLYRAIHGGLGTASPPFVMGLVVRADPLFTPLATLALLAAAYGLPRLTDLRSARVHAAALTGITLVLALLVGSSRTGTQGLSAIFDLGPNGSFEAPNEYLPGLSAFRFGPGFFLDRFAELVPSLPVNVAGHPPALMLVLHATGITTPEGLAALCIGAVALLPLLTTLAARGAGLTEAQARRAGALAALSPVVLLVGVTSADAIFAAVGAAAAALLVQRDPRLRTLGCLALAVAAFFSWALLAVGAWAAVVIWAKEGFKPAAVLAVAAGLTVLAFNLVLLVTTGYDALATLKATEAYYRNSVASVRPYWFWLTGSPTAFGLLLGPPIVAAALAAAVRRRPAALGFVVVVGVASLAGFTKAETERIWLPFVPLACIAAAEALPGRRLPLALSLLAVQAAAFSLLFDPVW